MKVEDVLDRGTRGLLAVRGLRGPMVAPVAFWYDGASAWTSIAADSAVIAALVRQADCGLWVPHEDGDGGVVARGRARVFSLRDARGLMLHAPTITAAMSVLALRNASQLVSQAADAARAPTRLLPTGRAVVRITIEEAGAATVPAVPGGIAPALPRVVPPAIRRALAGERRVVLAADAGAEFTLVPAVWSAGFALTLPERTVLPPGAAAAAALDEDGGAGSDLMGLCVAGTLEDGPALRPQRVTWWRGLLLATAEVPPAREPGARGAVVLPD